jgi:hypothetical protein
VSDPVLPGAALALPEAATVPSVTGEESLSGDAVAMAPEIAPDDAVAMAPAATPAAALPAVVPEPTRAQLQRAGLEGFKIERVAEAAQEFNRIVGDGRTIDELTLGLLWLAEGGARLTIKLEPGVGFFGNNHAARVLRLTLLGGSPAEMRRAWRITNIGLWGFGLDDIFTLPTGDPLTDYVFSAARARWEERLRDHAGWTHNVPFEHTGAVTNPATVASIVPVEITYHSSEAVGYLITVAARFTHQLWKLETELAARGLSLQSATTADIPLDEPVLAYLCYLQQAPKAAAIWEALMFLREFCADILVATPTDGGSYELSVLIGTLNRWIGPLRDPSELGLAATLQFLVKDATAVHPSGRLGRDVLAEVAARADWQPTIPAEADLDASGRSILEELVDAWATYATRVEEDLHGLAPGDLIVQGTPVLDALGNEVLDPAHPPLFPGTLGTVGFGARNYGTRFQEATGRALGGPVTRSLVPAIETGTL